MELFELHQILKKLFRQHTGTDAETINGLPLSGSNRKYFRIESGKTHVIGTYNSDIDENRAFFYLADQLKKTGANVPRVLIKDEPNGVYLQDDLGDTTLFEYVQQNKDNETALFDMYAKVIDQMPLLQVDSAADMDFSVCYPREAFDMKSILWDLSYFKYCFLKVADVPFYEQKLEEEFLELTYFLLKAPSNFFLFRDFQSRNIMLKDGEVYFIDFQGGRRGATQYDLASLLYEAKTHLSQEFRDKVLAYYLKVFSIYPFFNVREFLEYYPAFVLVRLFQAFGAYGYRGLIEKKAFFVQSIPSALENLQWVRDQQDISSRFPYLCEIIDSMQSLKPKYSIQTNSEELTVTITSFSYRNGFPDDWTGNGGGYVFDCRMLPNPGAFEEYKAYTGMDDGVIKFLEKESSVSEFNDSIRGLISQTLNQYADKNYNHLSVSFGCTGGRHRSVFCAEKLFNYIKLNFPVNIRLIHRELKRERFHDKNNVQKEP